MQRPHLRSPHDIDDQAYVARKRDGEGPDPGENEAHHSHYDGDYDHGSHHGGYSYGRGGHGHGHHENYHDNPGWQHREQGHVGHRGSNSYTHNHEDYKHSHQHQAQPRYSHSHYRHGGGEVCSQPPNIQDLYATSVTATGVLTLQAGGNINIDENNCRETKHIHGHNPHAHFWCPCDHGCNRFTTLMETHLQGDTCVGNYNTQGTVNLNSPCELPPGGGSYIRHMQVTGEGQLNVINKSGSHSVLNVERDINIDTLTCDTLVIIDWSY